VLELDERRPEFSCALFWQEAAEKNMTSDKNSKQVEKEARL